MVSKNSILSVGFMVCLWAMPSMLLAQKLEAKISSNPVEVGQRIEVSFTCDQKMSSFAPPSFDGFRILSGPNQSSSYKNVNGRSSMAVTFSYYLTPTKEGVVSIGVASAKVGGKTISSQPVKVRIVKGGGAKQQSKGQQSNNSGSVTENKDVFMQAKVSKTQVYQGEHISVTYTIYFRANIVRNEVSKLSSFKGFWVQDIKMPDQAKVYAVNLNGVRYQAADLKKSIIFPQRSGELEIDPMKLICTIRKRTKRHSHGFFNDIFGGYQDEKHEIKSKKIKIKVLPLPLAGKPAGYNGAVGKFQFKSTIDKKELKANEAVTIKMTISGSGNLKMVEPEAPDFPPDLEVYDPKVTDNITTSISGVSGSKSFEYLLVPRHAGEYEIPPFHFSYFDPQAKSYRSLASPSYQLLVAKGDETGLSSVSAIAKEDLQFIGSDILFIKSTPFLLKEKGSTYFLSVPFIAMYGAPFLLFFLFIVIRNKRLADGKDVVLVKRRRATRLAGKRLKEAKVAMKAHQRQAFFEAVLKGMWGYVSDKLNVEVANLSKEQVTRSLQAKEVDGQVINGYLDMLDKCEFARYAPANEEGEMELVYSGAMEIIEKLEGELK